METRWCYGCGEIKPLDEKHFTYTDKTHTKFRNLCRKCTNFNSMISHRIARARKKDKESEMNKNEII